MPSSPKIAPFALTHPGPRKWAISPPLVVSLITQNPSIRVGNAVTSTRLTGTGELRMIHSRVSWMLLPVDRSMAVSAPQMVLHCSFSTSCTLHTP